MKHSVRLFQLLFCFSVMMFLSCKEKSVKGDGNVVKEEIPIEIYNEIRVEGAMDIFYEAKPDEAAYLRVEADDNIIPLLDIQVSKNKLNIKVRESINPSRFVIYTNSPSLKYVENKGASTVHLVGSVAGDAFKIDQRGVGDFKADNLVFAKAEFFLRGAGNMELGGQIGKAKMEISGNGDIEAFALAADELECHIKGNGNMNIHPVEKLSVDIRGNGNVVYDGNPQITKQNIKGAGIVKVK
jgi:hypothetical protein